MADRFPCWRCRSGDRTRYCILFRDRPDGTDPGRRFSSLGAHLGAETAGYVRMVDVVIAAVIGLTCNWLFLESK